MRTSIAVAAIAATVALAAAAPGCVLYGQRTCDQAPPPPIDLLNPDTLACESFFQTTCDPACGPCPLADPPLPSWAACDTACTPLGEADCLATAGCRAAYDRHCYLGDGPCTSLTAFLGCYAIDTSGPITGPCDGLDVVTCSRHDDCVGLYDSGCANGIDDDHDGQIDEPDECIESFAACAAEPMP